MKAIRYEIDLINEYFNSRNNCYFFNTDLKENYKMLLDRKQKALEKEIYISEYEFLINFKNYATSLLEEKHILLMNLEEKGLLKDNINNDFYGFNKSEKLVKEDIILIIDIISDLISNVEQQKNEPAPLDLSNTTAVEKIIYLNELGIIDFLRTKTKVGISNGGLASVISAMTGMNPDTIKSSLNRLPKDSEIDNKHPYYTKKTVEKVKTFLTKLGF